MKRLELRVGAFIVGLVIAAALLSFVWTPFDPTLVGTAPRLQPPGWPLAGGGASAAVSAGGGASPAGCGSWNETVDALRASLAGCAEGSGS